MDETIGGRTSVMDVCNFDLPAPTMGDDSGSAFHHLPLGLLDFWTIRLQLISSSHTHSPPEQNFSEIVAQINQSIFNRMDFSIIDFVIGGTLVNALPHVAISIWNGRMLGGFGFGKKANILYGLFNLVVSLSLFIWSYGVDGLLANEMYLGGLFVVLCFILGGNMLYNLWGKEKPEPK